MNGLVLGENYTVIDEGVLCSRIGLQWLSRNRFNIHIGPTQSNSHSEFEHLFWRFDYPIVGTDQLVVLTGHRVRTDSMVAIDQIILLGRL